MHLYWRVETDLNEIGCFLIFKDPNLIREYERWLKKNAGGLAITPELLWHPLQPHPAGAN